MDSRGVNIALVVRAMYICQNPDDRVGVLGVGMAALRDEAVDGMERGAEGQVPVPGHIGADDDLIGLPEGAALDELEPVGRILAAALHGKNLRGGADDAIPLVGVAEGQGVP
jgi:hypothetical protein